MDSKDTESADVSETETRTEIFELGTIYVFSDGAASTSFGSGVVCRFHGAENGRDTIITVGLDKSRWREIPAGSDEEREVVDDSLEYDCVGCGSSPVERPYRVRFCQSCWQALGGKVHNKSMEESNDKGGA